MTGDWVTLAAVKVGGLDEIMERTERKEGNGGRDKGRGRGGEGGRGRKLEKRKMIKGRLE